MNPETHLALHRMRAAELGAEAEAYRLASEARQPHGLRTRLGWTLVEVGLRLATPKPALAPSPSS
ncbi:hypothetical protein ACFYO2_18320 [Streptomyces sp. NPDC006602]|uniref:hypothetical protein n=1 Tax=Streptomyces sp. NPDC006602 TaxID=3364751 RepID=UPI00368C519B